MRQDQDSLNRRAFLQGGLTAATAAKPSPPGHSARPNILWICTDQQRWDTIQALGNDRIRTPNIDRLVREGVAFTQAYCQNPVCTPSRGSFLTGCYPSTIRCTRNGNDFFPPENTPKLISRILEAAGYDCGMVGKFHLSSSYKRVEPRLDDGYRRFEWSHAPRW
ncbi:MAG: sulfatase-like hydrolase/transferase, partial [bacterium]|nr:sulfatase-like hydrolase/transferase [bacterium]